MTTTNIRIRGYHEDRFGHVNHARYLEFLEEARWRHLEEQGVGPDVLSAHRVFPVVVRMAVSYRRPARAGEELLITTRATNRGRRKIVLGQQARFATSDELCVEAEVTVLLLDEETGRPVPLDEDLLRAWPELRHATQTDDG